MGILDSLKKAAVETLKTVAEEAIKNNAGTASNTQAASAKAEALVGSKAQGAASNTPAAPAPNSAASAKAAALVGSRAALIERSHVAQNQQPYAAQQYQQQYAAQNQQPYVAQNQQPYAPPNELSRAEVESIIDARVRAKNMRSNWRTSIVDLMTALDMNSGLDSRRALAARLNYSGYDADGSAEKNMWLHGELLRILARNRGDVPWELMAAVNTAPPPVTPTPAPVTPMPNPAALSSNVAASVTAAALAASKAAALARSTTGPYVAPNELSRAEVDAIIDARVRAKNMRSNWRVSIVDLMTALDMNSSLAARTVLAAKLNYSGYDADGSAEKNMWLHAELLKALAQNRGEVPSYLL